MAAVTLKPTLKAIAQDFRGPRKNGLPADLFFSADELWIDELAQKQLIKPGTIINLISNHLVLLAREGTAERATIAPGFAITQLVGAGPLVMCDPDSHPAGRYAKTSLIKLGVSQSVEQKLPVSKTLWWRSKWWLVAMRRSRLCLRRTPRQIPGSKSSALSPTLPIHRSAIRSPSSRKAAIPMPIACSIIQSLAAPSVFRKLGYVILGSGK